jgi:hypothetical protein
MLITAHVFFIQNYFHHNILLSYMRNEYYIPCTIPFLSQKECISHLLYQAMFSSTGSTLLSSLNYFVVLPSLSVLDIHNV